MTATHASSGEAVGGRDASAVSMGGAVSMWGAAANSVIAANNAPQVGGHTVQPRHPAAAAVAPQKSFLGQILPFLFSTGAPAPQVSTVAPAPQVSTVASSANVSIP